MGLSEVELEVAIERLSGVGHEYGVSYGWEDDGGRRLESLGEVKGSLVRLHDSLNLYHLHLKEFILCEAERAIKSKEFVFSTQLWQVLNEAELRLDELDDMFEKHLRNVDDIEGELSDGKMNERKDFELI